MRPKKGGGLSGWGPKPRKSGGPEWWSPERWGPEGWGPKISRFFFPLPPQLSFFLLSLFGVVSWNLGGVFVGRDPEMCVFGLSGCRVKPQRLLGLRSALRLDTVDQGCSAQVREVATCGPQTVSRSSTRKMASATSVSEGESRYLHARSQLEAALAVFGDTKSPEVTMLQESVRLAQRAAQGRPVGVQLAQCELCCPGSEAAGFSRRGTSQIGFRVGGGQARLQRL